MLVSLIGGYYLGYSDGEYDVEKKQRKKEKERLGILKKVQETKVIKKTENSVADRLKKVLSKTVKKDPQKAKK